MRDAPLSESGFVGAGIGAALGGMRPIVEVMTINFSLLALDQVVNNAATFGTCRAGSSSVPLVVRMATGGGRQMAAQHAHSLEAWYAHIPGIKALAPATVEDARGMLLAALQEQDPVFIFEHALLYPLEGELDEEPRPVDIAHAAVRRAGTDVTLITYGGSLGKCLAAAEQLADEGIDAEVRRPADAAAARHRDDPRVARADASGRGRRRGLEDRRPRRARSARSSWRTASTCSTGRCSGSAAPRCRCPTPKHLSRRGAPERRGRGLGRAGDGDLMAEFVMPSLGADMSAGMLASWLKQPGDHVQRGDVIAVVHTDKADVEVEVFTTGIVERFLVEPGTEVPVGTPLAVIREDGAAPAAAPAPAAEPAAPAAAPATAAPEAPPAAAPAPAPSGAPLRHLAHLARPRVTWPPSSRSTRRRSRARGRGGRIQRRDVEAAARAAAGAPAPAPPPTAPSAAVAPAEAPAPPVTAPDEPRIPPAPEPAPTPGELRSLAMRRAISAAMTRSKREIPHFYLGQTIDMSRALAWLGQENLHRPVTERVLHGVAPDQGGRARAARGAGAERGVGGRRGRPP